MILGTPPMNILMAPFIFVYFLSKDKIKLRRMNAFLMHVLYSPNLIVLIPLFVCSNIILYPFAYFSTIYLKIRLLITYKSSK